MILSLIIIYMQLVAYSAADIIYRSGAPNVACQFLEMARSRVVILDYFLSILK